jgi:hypothetical protein
LVVLGLLGLVLGALLFGLVGGLVAGASTRMETTVRIRSEDSEYYFRHAEKRPDELRLELSAALMAIDSARAVQASDPHELADDNLTAGSVPDQLSKLASLLERGLITRDEFEQIKARLITET